MHKHHTKIKDIQEMHQKKKKKEHSKQNKRKLKGQKGRKQEASTYYQRFKLPWNLHKRTPERHDRTMLSMQLKTASRTKEKRIFKTFGDV
jgi:hypothetical protein